MTEFDAIIDASDLDTESPGDWAMGQILLAEPQLGPRVYVARWAGRPCRCGEQDNCAPCFARQLAERVR